MSWNYRVVSTTFNGEESFGIHEVYYDDQSEPTSITVNPVPVYSETLRGLKEELELMLEAIKKPLLKAEDFDRTDPITTIKS